MSHDLAHCEALLRKGSKSFFAASRLLPARVRAPAVALYAFCRTADDAVDDAERKDAARAVDALRARLDRVYAERSLDHPVERAFAAVADRFRIPRAVPDALVDGMEWDATGRRYETLDDLYAYCARVAASVGVMMTIVMGRREPHVLARACDLGVAMQLTNVARDVGEDAARGRLYLPSTWMREAGLDPEAWLARPAHDERLAGVVERALAQAEQLYARGDAGIAALPRDCRVAIRAAGLIYRDIGRVVAERRYDSVSARAVVSLPRKLWLLVRALLPRGDRALLGDRALGPVAFLVDAGAAA